MIRYFVLLLSIYLDYYIKLYIKQVYGLFFTMLPIKLEVPDVQEEDIKVFNPVIYFICILTLISKRFPAQYVFYYIMLHKFYLNMFLIAQILFFLRFFINVALSAEHSRRGPRRQPQDRRFQGRPFGWKNEEDNVRYE